MKLFDTIKNNDKGETVLTYRTWKNIKIFLGILGTVAVASFTFGIAKTNIDWEIKSLTNKDIVMENRINDIETNFKDIKIQYNELNNKLSNIEGKLNMLLRINGISARDIKEEGDNK